MLFYKHRRYVCICGKRFSEKSPFVDKYQRYSKEWNLVVSIRAIKVKTFKEAAEVLGTSTTTVIRRFKKVANKQLVEDVFLPKSSSKKSKRILIRGSTNITAMG
ncbi:helix-turn-helix domain-containing protein [Lysinibacillus xylanilyticus]|uniref:helix-turn-helix domain-containing protein n=1 Tax=Lysinibacillus xylanilyticus TaxID=582475 RepID=UPI003CFF9483